MEDCARAQARGISILEDKELSLRPAADPSAREVPVAIDLQKVREVHGQALTLPVLVFHSGGENLPRDTVDERSGKMVPLCERLPHLANRLLKFGSIG
jgi:hypothetical protein